MGTTNSEIIALEDQLRLAELGPDPNFFEDHLDDKVILVSETGEPFAAKLKVVEAHHPGKGPKFTRVDMSGMNVVDHGDAAVVSCKGTYEGPQGSVTLKFMRVWVKKNGRWKIVAGSVSK